jgi:hypothetical protein
MVEHYRLAEGLGKRIGDRAAADIDDTSGRACQDDP